MSTTYQNVQEKVKAAAFTTKEFSKKLVQDIKEDCEFIVKDVVTEYHSQPSFKESFHYVKDIILSFIHIPYLPAFHSPGWLLRYLIGPYDAVWLDNFLSDAGAGLTVGLTLIPQV
jgi:hypothetical protein